MFNRGWLQTGAGRLRALLQPRPLVSAAADLLGIALLVLGVWRLAATVYMFRLYYDEGILLSNAHFLLRGVVPYRDFYTNYPPGAFGVIAVIWKLFGVTEVSVRWLGFFQRVLVALAAGRVGGQLLGRRFSWLPAGAVACWLTLLNISPFAWLWALLFGFVFISLTLQARATGSSRLYAAAGVALGLIGCFRHDLFGFVAIPLVALLALPSRLMRPLQLVRPPWPALRALIIGAAVPLALTWIPLAIAAGPAAIIRDLVTDQARYVAPARDLPMPPLLVGLYSSLGAHLPVFLLRPFEGSVALTLVGPLFAVLLVACRDRRSSDADPGANWGPVLLAILTAAVTPQMMGRTDVHHSAATVAPALLAIAACAEALARRSWKLAPLALAGALVLLANPLAARLWPPPAQMRDPADPALDSGSPRARGLNERRPEWAAARQRLFPWLNAHTDRNDRIYFGARGHAQVHINEVDLYFLSDRKPGTRYTQFDPNLVTRGSVQREMIRQLEKNCVKTIVLSIPLNLNDPIRWIDPSTVIDEYIAEHYQQVETFPPYTIHQRRPDRPLAGCPGG